MSDELKLRKKVSSLNARLNEIERKYKSIFDEFEDLTNAVTKIVSAVYAEVPTLGTELKLALDFGESVLGRMRKKYG